MAIKPNAKAEPRKGQRGFTLLEVLVATIVLVVGVISLLGVFAYGFATIQTSQYDIIAKNEAREMLEAIYAARSSGQLTYEQINSTTTSPGVFLTGMQPALVAGPDGLFNTADDGPGYESLQVPGGQTITFNFMQRQISFGQVFLQDGITVDPDVRIITITIQYQAANFGSRTYTVNSYISRYR